MELLFLKLMREYASFLPQLLCEPIDVELGGVSHEILRLLFQFQIFRRNHPKDQPLSQMRHLVGSVESSVPIYRK
jgi:hypothetical protein